MSRGRKGPAWRAPPHASSRPEPSHGAPPRGMPSSPRGRVRGHSSTRPADSLSQTANASRALSTASSTSGGSSLLESTPPAVRLRGCEALRLCEGTCAGTTHLRLVHFISTANTWCGVTEGVWLVTGKVGLVGGNATTAATAFLFSTSLERERLTIPLGLSRVKRPDATSPLQQGGAATAARLLIAVEHSGASGDVDEAMPVPVPAADTDRRYRPAT